MSKLSALVKASVIAAALCSPLQPALAGTADFPNKPVRLIVAYPPGGSTDTQARILGQKLSERWKQPVVVENRPGGNTVIATSALVNSEADGYTLLLTAMPVALNPLVMSSLPYDTEKDLEPVALLTSAPSVFVVSPETGVKTVAEFIKKYKGTGKEPLLFGSAGLLTITHLSGELFASQSGIELQHIPYKGSAAAQQDLIGGRTLVMFDNGALQLIKAGRLTPLGVTSSQRVPWLPDVPTIAEQGFPDYHAVAWYGIFAKAGTPVDIIEKISNDINWAIHLPDVIETLQTAGIFPEGGSSEEFKKFLSNEKERWGKIIKEKNIKIE